MAAPWDIPPFPTSWDDTENVTFAAVGRALSAWERIEVELAHAYTKLVELPIHSLVAIRAYGAPLNFKERMDGLERAGAVYFMKRPNQALEGEFEAIVCLCRAFSMRRNDIAHGIVQHVQWIRAFHSRDDDDIDMPDDLKYCLLPPHYTPRRFDGTNYPLYAYTSVEIGHFTQRFGDLAAKVWAFWDSLP